MAQSDERTDKINDDITLIQLRAGLTFTTDAYLLSAYIRRPSGDYVRGAELGAGTGVVSLLAAARGKADRILAVEYQPRFYEIMRRNIENNGYGDKITALCADVRDHSLNENTQNGRFDYVFSNPPYIRADAGRGNASEEKNIARREVVGGIADFCAAASRLCRFGGIFYTVYIPERTAELLSELRSHSLEPKLLTFCHPDPASPPSLLFCAARYGGKPGMRVTRPLFIYKDGGRGAENETDIYKKIYETGSFPSEFTQL